MLLFALSSASSQAERAESSASACRDSVTSPSSLEVPRAASWHEFIMAYVVVRSSEKQTLALWLANYSTDRGIALGSLAAAVRG